MLLGYTMLSTILTILVDSNSETSCTTEIFTILLVSGTYRTSTEEYVPLGEMSLLGKWFQIFSAQLFSNILCYYLKFANIYIKKLNINFSCPWNTSDRRLAIALSSGIVTWKFRVSCFVIQIVLWLWH